MSLQVNYKQKWSKIIQEEVAELFCPFILSIYFNFFFSMKK